MKKTFALVTAALVSACSGSKSSSVNTNPGEPNDTIGQATQMTAGTAIVGTISTDSDLDYYKFTMPTGGATVRIQTFDQGGVNCDPTYQTVDTKVAVYDTSGTKVAESDDSGPILCEDFNVTLGAGTNYVGVSGWPPIPFVYTLKVSIL